MWECVPFEMQKLASEINACHDLKSVLLIKCYLTRIVSICMLGWLWPHLTAGKRDFQPEALLCQVIG